MSSKNYATEAELCAAFIAHNTASGEWLAYPESCGFDILMVRKADGLQIGIEAKLRLNAKVIAQAAERDYWYYNDQEGPDHRAVLVPPTKAGGALAALLPRLQLTCISFGEEENWLHQYQPDEPKFTIKQSPTIAQQRYRDWRPDEWYDLCPAKRCTLPAYLPDCEAGNPSPIQLTEWKIKAIKIAVIVDKVGFVTRSDFAYHEISMARWTQCNWLVPGECKGRWIIGSRCPPFAKQHPKNYENIKADYDTWKQQEVAV